MKTRIQYIVLTILALNSTLLKAQSDTLRLSLDQPTCDVDSFVIVHNFMDSLHYDFLWSNMDTSTFTTVESEGSYSLQAIHLDSLFILDSMMVFDSLSMMDTLIYIDSLVLDTIDLQYDTVFIDFRSSPTPSFSVENTCYGEEITILNNSAYFDSIYTTVYFIAALGTEFINEDEIVNIPSLTANGEQAQVYVYLDQFNACNTLDSFIIESYLVPQADFTGATTLCENESLSLVSNSLSVHSNNQVRYDLADNTFLNNGATSNPITISPYALDPGVNTLQIILNNIHPQATCADTTTYSLEVFDTREVSFTGLDSEYCHQDIASQSSLNGYFVDNNANVFAGSYSIASSFNNNLTDANTNDGNAVFIPNVVGDNINVTYAYTDNNGCTVSVTQVVDHVHPLPVVGIDSLKAEYCLFDDGNMIMGTPLGGSWQSNILLSNETIQSAFFDPTIADTHSINYQYTDANNCTNDITQTTIVHPLPFLDLGESQVLSIGSSLILGSTTPSANTEYLWSNGSMSSFIEIDNPGFYWLEAQNTVTGCAKSDTIQVFLSSSSDDEVSLDTEVLLYPMPFQNELNIESDTDLNSIEIVNANGSLVLKRKNKIDSSIELAFLPTGTYYIRFNGGRWIPIVKKIN